MQHCLSYCLIVSEVRKVQMLSSPAAAGVCVLGKHRAKEGAGPLFLPPRVIGGVGCALCLMSTQSPSLPLSFPSNAAIVVAAAAAAAAKAFPRDLRPCFLLPPLPILATKLDIFEPVASVCYLIYTAWTMDPPHSSGAAAEHMCACARSRDSFSSSNWPHCWTDGRTRGTGGTEGGRAERRTTT